MTTQGLGQISVSELMHLNRLPANPMQEEITWTRNQLIDPEMSITLLPSKFSGLNLALGLPESLIVKASSNE